MLLLCHFTAQDNISLRFLEEERTGDISGIGGKVVLQGVSLVTYSELWGRVRRGN